jgi:hypothetical protein
MSFALAKGAHLLKNTTGTSTLEIITEYGKMLTTAKYYY